MLHTAEPGSAVPHACDRLQRKVTANTCFQMEGKGIETFLFWRIFVERNGLRISTFDGLEITTVPLCLCRVHTAIKWTFPLSPCSSSTRQCCLCTHQKPQCSSRGGDAQSLPSKSLCQDRKVLLTFPFSVLTPICAISKLPFNYMC